jgi:hypothetical protein
MSGESKESAQCVVLEGPSCPQQQAGPHSSSRTTPDLLPWTCFGRASHGQGGSRLSLVPQEFAPYTTRLFYFLVLMIIIFSII